MLRGVTAAILLCLLALVGWGPTVGCGRRGD